MIYRSTDLWISGHCQGTCRCESSTSSCRQSAATSPVVSSCEPVRAVARPVVILPWGNLGGTWEKNGEKQRKTTGKHGESLGSCWRFEISKNCEYLWLGKIRWIPLVSSKMGNRHIPLQDHRLKWIPVRLLECSPQNYDMAYGCLWPLARAQASSCQEYLKNP